MPRHHAPPKIKTNTLKFHIRSFSYCCHPLIAFQPGTCPPFPSFSKTHGKEDQNKTDGTVHARRSANARTTPKLKRRPLATGRSGNARTKPKLKRRPQEKDGKKVFLLVRSSENFTFLSLQELCPSNHAPIHSSGNVTCPGDAQPTFRY